MQIIPTPTAETAKCGEFVLPEKIYLKTRKISNMSFIRHAKELTRTFFGGTSVLEVIETPSIPDKTAIIDSANSAEAAKLPSELSLGENEYVLDIEADGVTILFRDEKALIHAFMSFLMGFEMKTKGRYTAPCRLIEDRPSISFRGVHLCVFPETTLDFLKKCVRVCGMLKYTHIVIEFWGTYRYACTDLLSWDSAYTKEELLPIIDDIRGFGAEPVPMLNFLGHASQSRVMGGKHVTLDRYPEAEYLFENDGGHGVLTKMKHSNLSKVRQESCVSFSERVSISISAVMKSIRLCRETIRQSFLKDISAGLKGSRKSSADVRSYGAICS